LVLALLVLFAWVTRYYDQSPVFTTVTPGPGVGKPLAPMPSGPLELEIIAPKSADMALAPYGSPGQQTFDELFKLVGKWEPLKPSLAVMTNSSSVPIVMLVTQWTYRDTLGAEVYSHSSVSYLMNKSNPPVKPGESVLVTQLGWIPDPKITPQLGYSVPDDSLVNSVRRSAKVTVKIDGVLFKDGRILGPNTTGLLASVESGKLKVREALLRAQRLLDGGADVATVNAYLSKEAQQLVETGVGAYLEPGIPIPASSRKELADRLRDRLNALEEK
jgi:hypothetical protein